MAVGDTYLFPGFLTSVLTQLFFPKPPTTCSHASAEVRGGKEKSLQPWDRTHSHQVMSPSCTPLSRPEGGSSFLAPLAVGQRAYVMALCPSCVRPSVRALTFSLNIFFSETTYTDFDEISQKCSWHGPLQNLLKEFDSFKNSGCHGNKTEIFLKSLKIFLSETIMPRATKCGM